MAEDRNMTQDRTAIASAGAPIDPTSVVGWGVDADTRNDPTYPYRDRAADEGLTKNWERPPLQTSPVEILQSIEHIRKPAVFGTSTPPSGISGMIRRLAFRWSESNWLHWLLLMGADRINVVEGVVEDLGRGKIPNIPAEMGAASEWKHNKTGFAIKSAVVLGVAIGVVALVRARRGQNEQSSDHSQLSAAGQEALHDPKTFERYDAAMADLSDAGGASSLGGPAV
jgi:hypothetical protein